MSKKNMIAKWLLFVAVAVFCLVILFPIIIVLLTAFKDTSELSAASFRLFPKEWRFDNFSVAMSKGNWSRYFFNSIVVTVITVIGSIFFNTLCGYSLARLRFKGRKLILMLFMIGIMIPPQSYIIPQFIMLRSVPLLGGNDIMGVGGIGLLNSYAGLIIPFLSGSFGVFLSRQFYISFPSDLDDAAKIDGCTKFGIYTRIYVPLSGTLFATLTILKFVATWNDFFYPLIITNDKSMYTVQLGLQIFRGVAGVEWNTLMAATTLTILPVIVVFVFAQKYFVQGIVTTGMKA